MAGFIRPSEAAPVPVQPEGTQVAIRLIILLTFVLLMGFSWWLAGRFALSPQLSRRVKALLEGKKQGALSAQEQEEERNILKDLG